MIQEPLGADVIRSPLKVNGPAPPGAEEGYPTAFERRQGIARAAQETAG